MKHPERNRQREQRWTEANYEHNLWLQTRRRASHANIEWDLKIEDIVIPEVCPYLKTPLTRTQGQGVVWTNASVDRIDNSRGYTRDNIRIISRFANSMKQNATEEQLINFAEGVLRLHTKGRDGL